MIKLLTGMAGANFSYSAGETVTLDKDTERRLVESGQAEVIKQQRRKKADVRLSDD